MAAKIRGGKGGLAAFGTHGEGAVKGASWGEVVEWCEALVFPIGSGHGEAWPGAKG